MIKIMTKIMIAMIVCLRSHLFSHLKPGYSGTSVPGEYTTIIASVFIRQTFHSYVVDIDVRSSIRCHLVSSRYNKISP